MNKDRKFFNCSESHEISYLASKFDAPKNEVIQSIKQLCKEKKIHYSTHQEAEEELIKLGYKKK